MTGPRMIKSILKIRLTIEEYKFDNVNHLTISLGIGMAENSETLEKLVEKADKYLYIAKETGRNRVVSE